MATGFIPPRGGGGGPAVDQVARDAAAAAQVTANTGVTNAATALAAANEADDTADVAGTLAAAALAAAAAAAALIPYDWMMDGADATLPVASWVDVATLGWANSCYAVALGGGRVLQIQANLASDGVTAVTGARTQGRVIAVASGNFVHGLRIQWRNLTKGIYSNYASSTDTGVGYIDGASAANNSSYRMHYSSEGTDYAASPPYTIQGTSGSTRYGTTSAFQAPGAGQATQGRQVIDYWYRRSGTTLTLYSGVPGAMPALMRTDTIGTGAGYVGIRLFRTDSTDDIRVNLLAHRAIASAVLPWAP